MGFKTFLQEQAELTKDDIAKRKRVVISPGRFNPPHLGHKLMVTKLLELAKKKDAEPYIIVVDSGKRDEKNPLDGETRVTYLRKMFPKVNIVVAKNPYDAVEMLMEKGFVPAGGVTGSDRADSYKKMVGRIFGKEVQDEYEAKILARDPDADGVTGISASKVRAAAKAGETNKVRAMTGLNNDEAVDLIKKITAAGE